MKILYIAPNAAHQLEYVNSIYREMHDITVLTDSVTFHLRRFIIPNFEYSYKKIKGPFLMGFLRKLIYTYPFPNKFRLVRPVDPNNPEVGEIIQEWAKNKGAVAIRLMLAYEEQRNSSGHGLDVVMRTASTCNLPVNLLCWDNVEEAGNLAKKYPDTRLVVDHLGIKQPFKPPVPNNPFSKLQKVLELASYDNVVIKITGVCTLSHQAFPFSDIWDPLEEVFARFSLERCMWGTDWTRAINFVSYRESVDCFLDSSRLSSSEKAQLMGKTADSIYGWSAHIS